MNNDIIYALVENVEYDIINHFFIKIKESDKNKFRKFVEDTRHFGWMEELTIIAWTKAVVLETNEDESLVSIQTIDEYKENYLKNMLKSIKTLGDRHYLKGKEEYFIKLLNYNFESIGTN